MVQNWTYIGCPLSVYLAEAIGHGLRIPVFREDVEEAWRVVAKIKSQALTSLLDELREEITNQQFTSGISVKEVLDLLAQKRKQIIDPI